MLVEHPDTVMIVPVDGDEVVLVRQRRPGATEPTIEVPAGKIEAGETPREAAARELKEECGLAADDWEELGAFYAAAAYSTEYVHAFLARGLRPVGSPELEVLRRTLEQALSDTNDAGTLAAIALWRVKSDPC
jgi:ADP-ribose pyrophosphatase